MNITVLQTNRTLIIPFKRMNDYTRIIKSRNRYSITK